MTDLAQSLCNPLQRVKSSRMQRATTFDPLNLIHYQVARPGEPLPPLTAPAGYDYILAGNGVFKRGRNRHVEAVIPIAPCAIAGLVELETSIELAIPRLSPQLLEVALRDARAAGGIETAYLVTIRPLKRTFRDGKVNLVKPAQRGTPCTVKCQGLIGPEVILELHSHVDAPAFFSALDNEDQKGFRFYAVMGHIHTRPTIRLRLGMHDDHAPLLVTTLFESAGPFLDLEATTATSPLPASPDSVSRHCRQTAGHWLHRVPCFLRSLVPGGLGWQSG